MRRWRCAASSRRASRREERDVDHRVDAARSRDDALRHDVGGARAATLGALAAEGDAGRVTPLWRGGRVTKRSSPGEKT